MSETTEQVKHTALPWRYDVGSYDGLTPSFDIHRAKLRNGQDGPAQWIAIVHGRQCDHESEVEANAELICRAVNSHDDLLAFVQQCANDDLDRVSPGVKRQAAELLAKAEKGEK